MLNLAQEVAALERMTVGELRARYAELFEEETRACNRLWLIRRITWRMQSLQEGGLSERAFQRAQELANTSDLRVTAPRKAQPPAETSPSTTAACHFNGDTRVPLPGTLLTRRYKGRLIQVTVVTGGFEFEGQLYKSLSAVAKQITGSHWNGYKFFNLQCNGAER